MTLRRWGDCNLGRRNPHLVKQFKEILVNGKVYATKRNYATCIIDFIRFCHDNGEPVAFNKSLNPRAVMYWMQNRVWQLDSSNSHKTWSAALSWYCQSHGWPFRPPRHALHPDFAMYYENVKRAAHKKSKAKQPILARHIWRFIRDDLKVIPGQLHKSSYDNVLKACVITLIFLTISRCMEVLWSDKTEDKSIREIITGLRWEDIHWSSAKGHHGKEVLSIKIRWFKNQEDRRIPKHIQILSPCCGHSTKQCVCPYFDIFAYLRHIKQTRRNRFNNICPFRKSGKGQLGSNQTKNLSVGPKDFIFVNARGTICKYRFISDLIKQLAAFNKIDTSQFPLTPHSLRIGATSLAHHQGIDPLKIMRYVEWKPSASPTMHAHYVRYTIEQLALVPFEMLHGTLQFGEPTQNCIQHTPVTFELRAEVIRSELYEGKNKRKTKQMRSRSKPVYDKDPTIAMERRLGSVKN